MEQAHRAPLQRLERRLSGTRLVPQCGMGLFSLKAPIRRCRPTIIVYGISPFSSSLLRCGRIDEIFKTAYIGHTRHTTQRKARSAPFAG